ncbi:MAG: hypothetical protein OEY77_11895 [Nitrospira sp.]|nr:hypothetical protein [Nitrospira sp.]
MKLAAIKVRVHRALEQRGTGCSMAEVVTLCPELTWNQVFLTIDDLSRAGQVRVTRDGHGTDRVQALTPSRSRLPRHRRLLCKQSVNIRTGLGNP